MARPKSVFECSSCGERAPKWMGQCAGCSEWNTIVESMSGQSGVAETAVGRSARPLSELDQQAIEPLSTGVGELDRVLGGGFAPGSLSLVGGEPGIGKSTLLGQAASQVAQAGHKVLYISAEESVQQVSARLRRLGEVPDNLWVGDEPNLGRSLADLAEHKPAMVIIDSIQTMFDPALGSAPGSVAQVRHCAHELGRAARAHNAAVVLVGQVTKDGNLAGPRVLEHLVDTVISFEGDRNFGLRLLRAVKHRFGATGEVGVFEMTGRGLVEVGDPSGLLLSDRRPDVPGSAITVTCEGYRPLVVELQSLVTAPTAAMPRRSTQGIDQSRLSMLLAVLTQRAGVAVAGNDVYASVIGGVRISEPGVDLGLVCAIASSVTGQPIGSDTVIIGEVGLAGEVRSVAWIDRRLAEAARLGFRQAIVPAASLAEDPPMECVPVPTVAGAINALDLRGG